jgi:hypothetical protein
LPGPNWNWNNIKLTAGPFQNDNYSDLAMFHLANTSDAGVHVLYGNPGLSMFNNATTGVRTLWTVPDGWNWYHMTL